jgi:hypothetical protein
MAVVALLSPKITIATIDMSAFSTAIAMDVESEKLTTTNFGSAGFQTYIAGLKGGEVKISFNDDFAATTVDDRIWGWWSAGVAIAFAVKATQAATSPTNPEYQFNVLPLEFSPLAGKVGELATMDITWPVTGTITRAVA